VPLGRFELRDLGIGKEADPLFDLKRYKRSRITRLMAFYPQLKFVLIGDSGQADDDLYAELATHAQYRSRILAVYIRNVSPPTDEAQLALANWRQRVGERFVPFDNSHVAAVDAARRGLIAPSSLDAIQKAASMSGSLRPGQGTRRPIVLAHGLLGFNRLGVEGFAALTYFRGIADHLRAHGYRVLVTEVGKTDGVPIRAAHLKMSIERFTAGKVNIIGHSMGGLDARYMISRLGMADRVASLTTIGTPHRGSSFADWGIEHFGDSSPLLEALGVGTQAFYDLTSQSCARFNERTPNAPSVRYYSFSGTQTRKDIYGALQISHDIIREREGPNDGLVSQRSARWGHYLGNLDADHLNEVGWKFVWEFREKFDAKEFYLKLAEMLRDEGF